MENFENEEWRDIEGYEGCYQVSDNGRVVGLSRIVKNGVHGQILLKPKSITLQCNNGYMSARLTTKSKTKGFLVHRLVAIAFIPNPENKPEVNHKDGNKQNNHKSNLEWATRGENMRHARDTGLKNGRKGSAHVQAKLTEVQVLEIRSIKNMKQQDMANAFGVTKTTISAIVTRRNWKHI